MPESAEETSVLSAMVSAGRAVSTPEVMEQTGYSWVTAKKYLRRLQRKNLITARKVGKTVYWRILEEGEKPPEKHKGRKRFSGD